MMMMISKYALGTIGTLLMFLLASCLQRPSNELEDNKLPRIWPDYADVTIPVDIAPLNFVVDSADLLYVKLQGSISGCLETSGKYADFDIDSWHDLTRQNRGADIIVTVSTMRDGQWTRHMPFPIHVSQDSLADYGITYRKIAPGYETYSDIGIYQRDIHSFNEDPIITSSLVPGQCMCCHTANRANPRQLTMHLRGKHPATLIQIDGRRQWLTTKTDSTISNCMYPYWHPSGNFCAYSLSIVHQNFYTGHAKFIEVFDLASDACVLDVRTNQLILAPPLQSPDVETYPVFSADGNTIFFCTSKPHRLPAEAHLMRYDLCSIGFDAEQGRIDTHVDTLIKVSDKGHSITLPRPSYDGRFIIYCLTDYGYFPIDHPESDLHILDLKTMESRPLAQANSSDTESFHNWSSNSRWIVFSSRRHDSMTSLAYFAHIDTLGNASKPFLLPQRNPREFYTNSLHSFNTPDFTSDKVYIDPRATYDEVFSDERTQVTVK